MNVFAECVAAIERGDLIKRESSKDKEFHFQNWVQARLKRTRLKFDDVGRNTYPDFRLVASTGGFEVKGLAYPGREANYDCNSQVPSGSQRSDHLLHLRPLSGETGRQFLSSFRSRNLPRRLSERRSQLRSQKQERERVRNLRRHHDPRQENVCRTDSVWSHDWNAQTLILPAKFPVDDRFRSVGTLVRFEADNLILGYSFNLKTNALKPESIKNPGAGRQHEFIAYRLKGSRGDTVALRPVREVLAEVAEAAEHADD